MPSRPMRSMFGCLVAHQAVRVGADVAQCPHRRRRLPRMLGLRPVGVAACWARAARWETCSGSRADATIRELPLNSRSRRFSAIVLFAFSCRPVVSRHSGASFRIAFLARVLPSGPIRTSSAPAEAPDHSRVFQPAYPRSHEVDAFRPTRREGLVAFCPKCVNHLPASARSGMSKVATRCSVPLRVQAVCKRPSWIGFSQPSVTSTAARCHCSALVPIALSPRPG